jgi:hypothetical protein
MKLLEIIRTLSFSTIDTFLMLYLALVGYKLGHASVARNIIRITHSNKLVHLQVMFATLFQNIFFETFSAIMLIYQKDKIFRHCTPGVAT